MLHGLKNCRLSVFNLYLRNGSTFLPKYDVQAHPILKRTWPEVDTSRSLKIYLVPGITINGTRECSLSINGM